MANVTLITGPASSGKSKIAEGLIAVDKDSIFHEEENWRDHGGVGMVIAAALARGRNVIVTAYEVPPGMNLIPHRHICISVKE